jgi:AcrR family transcriptional regulator
MKNKQTKDPKERILYEAAALFAEKGFSSVGVREISAQADVNISMISYYYNGKIGILKAIIEEYFKDLDAIVERISHEKLSPDAGLKKLITELIVLIRTKQDFCKVAIAEMPFNVPEVEDLKVQLLAHHIKLIRASFHHAVSEQDDPMQHVIIGPAFISLIFSHFLFGHIVQKAYDVTYDEEFFQKYSDQIATLFLFGMTGFAGQQKQGGHPQGGHPQGSHPQGGHPQRAHPQDGHPQGAHPQDGHPQGAHPQDGHPQGGHPQDMQPLGGPPQDVKRKG